MRTLNLLGCSLLSLAATGCFGSLPGGNVDLPVGSQFTITLSNSQSSNVSVGTYEMEGMSGAYVTNAVLSLSSISASKGSNPAANHAPCQVINVIFVGKPEAGKQWQLLLDSSDSSNGGQSTAPGTGTLNYVEVCPDAAKARHWLSASGTLRIDSVADPDPRAVPPGQPSGALKTVTFTLVDVTMVLGPDNDTHATGTFTVNGEGRIELLSGMDKP